MAFLLDVCCCSCLKNPPEQLRVSVAGITRRANIRFSDPPVANPAADISAFNGTWYLDGPESHWRSDSILYDLDGTETFFATGLGGTPEKNVCAYTADISPIALDVMKDDGDRDEIHCTIEIVKLAFVIAQPEDSGYGYRYRLALVWLDGDDKAIASAYNQGTIPYTFDGYDVTTRLGTDWPAGHYYYALHDSYLTLAKLHNVSACSSAATYNGYTALDNYYAEVDFYDSGATISVDIP